MTKPTPRKIYVALPYSHPSPDVRQIRADIASAYCAGLMNEGHIPFCGISMRHPWTKFNLPKYDIATYWEIDCALIDACTDVHVLMIEGYEESEGIRAEIDYIMKQTVPKETTWVSFSEEELDELLVPEKEEETVDGTQETTPAADAG